MAQGKYPSGFVPITPPRYSVIGKRTSKRVRLFEYGPSVGRVNLSAIPRITTSVLQDTTNQAGTRRKRIGPGTRLGFEETNKSILRPKVFKGLRYEPPGHITRNYPSPLD